MPYTDLDPSIMVMARSPSRRRPDLSSSAAPTGDADWRLATADTGRAFCHTVLLKLVY
jgi:hypothetical protein